MGVTGRHASHQTPAESDAGAVPMLICRAGARRFAVPIESVIETMRPLPVGPLPGLPAPVTGVSQIRGEPVPVIDVQRLLDDTAADAGPAPSRLVTLALPGRTVALAVTEVLGVEAVPADAVGTLAPLLAGNGPDRHGVLAGIGTVDGDLLLVLDQTRLLPDDAWEQLDAVQSVGLDAEDGEDGATATPNREVRTS